MSIKKVIGGAERVLHEQTKRLSERGHEIHIITRRLPIHASSYENIKNVHEWRYAVNKKNAFTFLVSTVVNCQKLFRQISENTSFDIINYRQPFSAIGINLRLRNQQIKKVYNCHSLAFEEYETRNPKPFKVIPRINHKINSYLRKRIEKFCMSSSNLIVVESEYTKNKLINQYGIKSEKIFINPGGVDLSRFKFSQDKTSIRKRLKLSEEKFILFTVRNLVPRMGLENLILAMKEIIKSLNNIYLIIGGEGEQRKSMTNLISDLNLKDNVKLQGFIPEEDLPLYYRAADFFILPTKWLEGFGLVTVEAMACGTPVLGTPVGGTQEILNKFNPSFLFKDTNPESMAELIINKYNYYKDKPDEFMELSQKCRKFIEENYTWEKNIDNLERLFNTTLK